MIIGSLSQHSVFIIGGFLRSIANVEQPRDLDVIFNLSHEELQRTLNCYKLPTTTNRFGGFKILLQQISVDVWASEKNWAFVENVVQRGSKRILSGVAHGTFLNYDSLVFVNVTGYNDCVATQTMTILRKKGEYSERNPGGIANVLKAFRIRKKTNLQFSPLLARYIFDQLKYNNASDYYVEGLDNIKNLKVKPEITRQLNAIIGDIDKAMKGNQHLKAGEVIRSLYALELKNY